MRCTLHVGDCGVGERQEPSKRNQIARTAPVVNPGIQAMKW